MRSSFVIGLIFCCCLTAQAEIRRLVIDDFSGGINRTAPSQVANNQCYDMVDFDVTVNGVLTPRQGFDWLSLASDSTSGSVITGLVPHNKTGLKHLLIQRGEDTTLWSHVKAGTEDLVLSTLHAVINSARPQTGVSSFYYKGNTYIASQGSEMMVYDGTKMWPARPLGPGQPSAVAIDNTSHLSTLTANYVQYRYTDSALCIPDPNEFHSLLSIPSFPVHVYNGAVLVTGLINPTDSCEAGAAKYELFRSIDGGPYKMLTYPNATWLLDTLPAGSAGAEPTYPNGFDPRCYSDEDNTTPTCNTQVPGPGAISSATAYGSTTPTYWITYPDSSAPWSGDQAQMMGYSIVFQDSAGRKSYMAPPHCVKIGSNGKNKIALAGIPTPLDADTFMVKQKLLIRSFGRACDAINCPGAEGDFDTTTSGDDACRDPGNWYIVDTLVHTATTFTDSMPCCSLHIPSRLYCGVDPLSIVTFSEHIDSVGSGFPQLTCQDSVIAFKPTQIIQRGAQAFAIGDPENLDRIYFSTFYDASANHGPTTWVADKFWEIPSDKGDWFVRLAVLGDAIYAFRQNSIVKISGFTFYQYQIEVLSNEVGAISPQSVATTLTHIYFLDGSGVYITAGGPPQKISTPIDSMFIWQDYRFAIGKVIDNNYWLQTNGVPKTLLFDEFYGAWRRYDLDYDIIANYGTDTAELDWIASEPILGRNDSLFQQHIFEESDYWDTAGYYSYTSRILFDGPERVKVHYVDIQGYGRLDSIRIISYREAGEIVDSVTTQADSLIWSSTTTEPLSTKLHLIIDEILPVYKFQMKCFPRQTGTSLNNWNFGITSIVIGWQPWDEGRPR